MKNLQKIELLNFEGPVLMAHKKRTLLLLLISGKK
jgi:hypothetical protein